MAGAITHLLVADAAAERAQREVPRLAKAIAKARPFLLLGSVSPDLPYAMVIPGKGQQIWADRFHYLHTSGVGTKGPLDLGQRNLLGTPMGDSQLAWVAGYVAHCVTDATIHPIVQAIVGPYHTAPDAHRICEMIQDSLLFSETRECDLRGTHYVDQLKTFVRDREQDFRGLVGYWCVLLRQVYGEIDPQPQPEEWHSAYGKLLDVAADNKLAMVLSRVFTGAEDYLYDTSKELRAARKDEAEKCFDLVPVPDQPGERAKFSEVGFARAVENTLVVWQALDHDAHNAKKIVSGDLLPQVPNVLLNWNLDTGANMDLGDGRVTYWPGSVGS